ncbi:MAG TPA: RNA polymerase sigma factor [Thermoanaerobaculia bacterium]|nr:RNA polymerase sigma factor [Thermoanaerobaculia bacterium]
MTPIAETLPSPLRPEALTDEAIVARVRSGELQLYEILMRRYNQRLFRIARSVLADGAEAEDVTQEAWVRAYEHLGRFDGRATFATWVTKIALHDALARRRRRRRLVDLDLDRARNPQGSRAQRSPEQETLVSELRRALESAVAALPETLRAAFVLRDVEGLSTADASAVLEISEAALKVRLHRARRALRRELECRAGEAAGALWAFGGQRCDRTVATVLQRVAEH